MCRSGERSARNRISRGPTEETDRRKIERGEKRIGYPPSFARCYRFKIDKKSNHTLYQQRRHTQEKIKVCPEALFLECWPFFLSRRWVDKIHMARGALDRELDATRWRQADNISIICARQKDEGASLDHSTFEKKTNTAKRRSQLWWVFFSISSTD